MKSMAARWASVPSRAFSSPRTLTTLANRSSRTQARCAAAAGRGLAWVAGGLVGGFSGEWLLVIKTGATVSTFLMVFLLQRSQNRDALAVQLKLNELIAAGRGASNKLIAIEDVRDL